MPSAPPRLFLDANVFIAASASSQGGSSLLIEFCQSGRATALASKLVLRDAERNIHYKLDDDALTRFYQLLARLDPEIVPLPDSSEIQEAAMIVHEKDAHVLAAARSSSADYLITLDQKHFLAEQITETIKPIVACTPGEFFKQFLAE